MLKLVLVAWLLPACYSPTAHNCTLECSTDRDCISGQACTGDHFCASRDIATCASLALSDGGTSPPLDSRAPPTDGRLPPFDGPLSDAAPPSLDAASPPQVELRVVITGNGSVHVSVGTDCDLAACTYSVAPRTAITLTAVNHGNNVFQQWQGAPCAGQGSICQLTANAATTAAVVFAHEH